MGWMKNKAIRKDTSQEWLEQRYNRAISPRSEEMQIEGVEREHEELKGMYGEREYHSAVIP